MSRSNHNSKGPGFEYWKSRLHNYCDVPGRDTKAVTHRRERRTAKHKIVVTAIKGGDLLLPPQESRMG